MQLPNYHSSSPEQQAYQPGKQALSGKTVLISGATGGLGTVLSQNCAAAGACVVLAGRSMKKLEKLYDSISADSELEPVIVELQQDKAGPNEYAELAELLKTQVGGLDALVHCSADLGTPTPLDHIEHSEWMRVMNVNLTAARLLTLNCLPLLQQSELGSITFLLDNKTTAFWGGYGVSKQALQTFMHMLADETKNKCAPDGNPIVAVNGYNPGPIRTPMRRRSFPGELETETPLPQTRLGPLLSLLARTNRQTTGIALAY